MVPQRAGTLLRERIRAHGTDRSHLPLAIWTHWGRPSGIRILGNTLYAVDSESRSAPGEYGHNPGWHRGIYVGTLDGMITDFIPDPSPSGNTSFPEGIGVGDDGVIWGASVGDRMVYKFERTR